MRNTLGDLVTLTLFGESHQETIGAVIDGLCPGIKIDEEFINKQLSKRRPRGKSETKRVELDNYKIVSGVFNGYTTGDALCVLIENTNTKSKDYNALKSIMRPSHADYTTFIKSKGFNDYRGGGHTSGRITAPIVLIGSIIIKQLEKKGIYLGTHIKKCMNVEDKSFENLKDIIELNNKSFPVLNDIEDKINNITEQSALNKDSVGGILETMIYGLPAGLGDPWFSGIESKLSNALFGIGAIKGIEFGEGFNFSNLYGSECKDEFYYDENKLVKTYTNFNGGINGGITNGMPVVFNTVVKPTPSIGQTMKSIDIEKKENVEFNIEGRHDPFICRRMCVVIDSIVAITLADILCQTYGINYLYTEE